MTPEQIKTEFKADYGIEADEIIFDPDGAPFFTHDALSILAEKLAPQIRNVEVQLNLLNKADRFITVDCGVFLENGTARNTFGSAFVPERKADQTEEDEIKAFDLALGQAKARALRSGLRSVGFDPIKAHLARKGGNVIALQPRTEEDEETTLRKAIHALRDEMNLDAETYQRYLVLATGKPSSKQMSIAEMSKAYTYLQGLNEGRKRRLAA